MLNGYCVWRWFWSDDDKYVNGISIISCEWTRIRAQTHLKRIIFKHQFTLRNYITRIVWRELFKLIISSRVPQFSKFVWRSMSLHILMALIDNNHVRSSCMNKKQAKVCRAVCAIWSQFELFPIRFNKYGHARLFTNRPYVRFVSNVERDEPILGLVAEYLLV